MNLHAALTRLEKLTIDNSPSILTAVGVTGVVTTAVLTGKASIKAYELLQRDHYAFTEQPPTAKERVDLTWKLYIPAVGSGILTIAAVVSSNQISTRRAAGIAAAFTLSERAYDEYKSKVVEKLGQDKERALRDELAQDRVSRTEGSSEVVIVGTEVLCLDEYSGRYFKSDHETIRRAENEVNHQLNNNSYASLTDLYDKLGLEKTSMSDEVGWNHEQLLKIDITTALSSDGRPCLSLSYNLNSNRDYWRNR